MKTLDAFNLKTPTGRYRARKAGFEVPKLPHGVPKDFWLFVDKTEHCWIWTGRKNRDGYGRYCNAGNHMAHRYAWEQQNGRAIGKAIAMHTCDNPACVRPDHVVIGTHAMNQQDKTSKNRQAKGETNGCSILTDSQVVEARNRYAEGGVIYKDLAKEYGVCKDTMQKAIRGIYWKHIDGAVNA